MSNNKAREIHSPLIKQLIDETTPEELAKIDTDMTNNKQQTEINAVEYISKVNQFAKENNTGKPKQHTAVEWYSVKRDVLEIEVRLGKLSPIEYAEELVKAEQQAKEMENSKAFEIFKAGQDSMEEGGKGFEQHYNETYK